MALGATGLERVGPGGPLLRVRLCGGHCDVDRCALWGGEARPGGQEEPACLVSEWGRGVGGTGWGVTEWEWGAVPGAPHRCRVLREEEGLGFGHRIHSGCGFSRRKQGARSWAGSQDRSPRREGKELGPGRGERPGGAHVTHLRLAVSVDRQASRARLLPQQGPGAGQEWVVSCWLGAWWVEGTSCKDWVGGCRKEEAQVGRWEGTAELRDPQGCEAPEAGPGRAAGGWGLGSLV